ncbi:hypothetical protein [Pedobacter sp. GR22-10]|uniref:hypothetical protein n=1 Tax=Pedobacter sp. GR22-10 TaxID=2994472 RepID=UPI0022475CD2|nr:hypothetical protein [Pedobacter sp. GR22-10]MCX2429845.1 hypothetical protein [Pedobacter sp. GR22-10]
MEEKGSPLVQLIENLEARLPDVEIIPIRSASSNIFQIKLSGTYYIFIDDTAIESAANLYDYIFKVGYSHEKTILINFAIDCKRLCRIFLENGYGVHAYSAMDMGQKFIPELSYTSYQSGLETSLTTVDKTRFIDNYCRFSIFHEYAHVLLKKGKLNRERSAAYFREQISQSPIIKMTVAERRASLLEKSLKSNSKWFEREASLFAQSKEFENFYSSNPLEYLSDPLSLDEFICDDYACEQLIQDASDNMTELTELISNLTLMPFMHKFNNMLVYEMHWMMPFLAQRDVHMPELSDEDINVAQREYSQNNISRYRYVQELFLRWEFLKMKISNSISQNFPLLTPHMDTFVDIMETTVSKATEASFDYTGPIHLWHNEPKLSVLKMAEHLQAQIADYKFPFQQQGRLEGIKFGVEEYNNYLHPDLLILNRMRIGELQML